MSKLNQVEKALVVRVAQKQHAMQEARKRSAHSSYDSPEYRQYANARYQFDQVVDQSTRAIGALTPKGEPVLPKLDRVGRLAQRLADRRSVS